MGYFKLERGWSEHIVFDDEPLTQREAWIWLIEHAAWRDTVMSVGRERYQVKRGQLAASLRYLALRWKWTKDRVWRFLTRLKNETMIATAEQRHASIITICNYAKYQDDRDRDETETATATATDARQPRDKEEGISSIEAVEGKALSAPPPKEPRRGKQSKTRFDPDWQPTGEDCDFARGLGLDPGQQRDALADWAIEKQVTSAEWSRRYRNWCRKSAEFAAKRTGGGGRVEHRQGPSSEFAAASRALARLQGER